MPRPLPSPFFSTVFTDVTVPQSLHAAHAAGANAVATAKSAPETAMESCLAFMEPSGKWRNAKIVARQASSLFSCGKRITSRIEGLSVNSITSRSMPMPSPAAGGIPYSSARM